MDLPGLKAEEERAAKAREENAFEGGFGGQEGSRDKYATTRGDN